jgi:flavodoxin I
MDKVGLFYASETGNTRKIAKLIQRDYFAAGIVDLHPVEQANAGLVSCYPALIFGTSTVADGAYPETLEEFLPELEQVDFTDKRVALFGLGDQVGYPMEFVDALGMLYDRLNALGARLFGHWPTDGYEYEFSKADLGDGRFCGLVLDQDNEPELTARRLELWIDAIRSDLLSGD